MIRRQMVINGRLIEVVRFSSRAAADRYIARTGKEMVFARAHEYYVGWRPV